MKKTLLVFFSCLLSYCSFAQAIVGTISGPKTVCVGDTVTLHCDFFAILGWQVYYPTDYDTSIVKIKFYAPTWNDILVIGIAPGIAKIMCYNTIEEYDTITETVTTCATGIPETSVENKIEVYPNPATSALTISATDKIKSVTISNLTGQILYNHTFKADKIEIDVSDFPASVYFIKINGIEVRKFVKQF